MGKRLTMLGVAAGRGCRVRLLWAWAVAAGWGASGTTALAAPLDALLTAMPERGLERGTIELGLDAMNQQFDVFSVRSASTDPAKATGDYQGAHLSGGLRVGDKGWVFGSLWQRAVGDATDTYQYTSWQLSGQYRFLEAEGAQPAVAIRLSGWGNYAAATETTTPVVVPGAKLDRVKVNTPSDQQLQMDMVGSWRLSPATQVSALLGVGATQLSYGGLSASTTLDGCHYNLAFTGNAVYGTLASPCSSDIYLKEFYDNSGRLGIDVEKEIAWHGSFVQAGVNGNWQSGPWSVQAGYLFHVAQREAVDSILSSRKQASYTQNHTVVLQGSYRFAPTLRGFARVQWSSNLFFNELPVTYNTSSAARFDSTYSIITVGAMVDF